MAEVEQFLQDKRNEILWALEHQGYTAAAISRMFQDLDRFKVFRLLKEKPEGYKPKWIKTP